MTEKQRAFCEAYLETQDEKKAALLAGYQPKDALRMAKRALQNHEVRGRLLQAGAPLPDETAAETMKRRIAYRMEAGELKASEEFRAMELLWKLQKESQLAKGERAHETIKVVRFEGVLEQWSR